MSYAFGCVGLLPRVRRVSQHLDGPNEDTERSIRDWQGNEFLTLASYTDFSGSAAFFLTEPSARSRIKAE